MLLHLKALWALMFRSCTVHFLCCNLGKMVTYCLFDANIACTERATGIALSGPLKNHKVICVGHSIIVTHFLTHDHQACHNGQAYLLFFFAITSVDQNLKDNLFLF